MATDATIIVGKLDSDELEKSIDKLVRTVNDKMDNAATAFSNNIGKMETALNTFATNANTAVNNIKQAFTQLGTTYEDFAKAMAKASTPPSGDFGGGGGSGRGGGGGSASSITMSASEIKQKIAQVSSEMEVLQNKNKAWMDMRNKILDTSYALRSHRREVAYFESEEEKGVKHSKTQTDMYEW